MKKEIKNARRKLLKALGVGGGAIATSKLPSIWLQPAVESAVLPAHAVSTTCPTRFSIDATMLTCSEAAGLNPPPAPPPAVAYLDVVYYIDDASGNCPSLEQVPSNNWPVPGQATGVRILITYSQNTASPIRIEGVVIQSPDNNVIGPLALSELTNCGTNGLEDLADPVFTILSVNGVTWNVSASGSRTNDDITVGPIVLELA